MTSYTRHEHWKFYTGISGRGGTAEEPNFSLSTRATSHPVETVRVSQLALPYNVDNITSAKANNVFALEEKSSGAVWTVTVPDGNYTYASLAAYLQNELLTMTPPGSAAFVQSEFLVSYDAAGHRFTVSADTTASGTYHLHSATGSVLLLAMGFTAAQHDTDYTDATIALYPPHIVGTNVIHIVMDGVTNTHTGTLGPERGIILTVPVTVDYGELIQWTPTSANQGWATVRRQLQHVHFKLLDDNYDVLVNHNFNWSMSLEVNLG